MADPNEDTSNVVTIKEAIEQVKKWSEEKDYDKVIQGCNEILEVEPDNEEIKTLLEQANQSTGNVTEAPAETPEAPAAPEEATPEPEPEAEMATVPLAGEETAVSEEPAPAEETPKIDLGEATAETPEAEESTPEIKLDAGAEAEQEAASEPEVAQPEAPMAPEEEMPMAKPEATVEPEETIETTAPEEAEAPMMATEEKPAKSGFSGQKLALIIILVIILGGLVFSFFQGWLNPLFESVLGLFGL